MSADITQFEINSNYMHKSLKLNRTACAKINVESAGLDEKGSVLKFDYDLHLDDSVNWISLISHSISNFTDELDLIVDGNIVKNLTITNSFYNKYKSLYSDNVFNAIHMYNDFIYNNLSNIKAKIYVYNAITHNIHDLDSLMKINESYFFSNSLFTLSCSSMNISWENTLLDLVMDYYKLTNNEKDFVKNHHTDFYDTIKVSTTYPGDYFKKYKVLNEEGYYNIQFLGNTVVRSFKINYINGAYLHTDNNKANHSDGDLINMKGNDISYEQKNIEGHYVNSDYDAFLTFTFVNTKLNNKILSFYLNEKNKIDSNGNFVYNNGFMKASYGSFLNGLLTFYCVDLFADIGAKLFNVSWTRNSPIAISVQDNHDRTILSGECDFRFGMDVVGEESNVRGFNFLVSSSFSQIEHWVMNALFPGISPYGSVTYGLGNVLLNDGSLEILLEDGFVVIKEVNSNVRTLIIDISSGRVMDLLNTSYNGAFCYSNQQTDWACDFGYALLNNTNIFETLVNYFNNVNNTFYYLQDIINGAFESIDDYLDSSNNLILGTIGGFIITAGISLLLISNPVGWVILGSIALVSLGGLLTYYADDLNRGWTAERMSNFIFDISLSLIPGIGFEGRVGKIVLVKEVNRYITKNSMDDLGKIIISYAIEYGFSNVKYIKYGKLESIMHTVIGNTNIEIGKYLFGISIGNVIDIVLDYYYNKENSWIYSKIGDII